MVQRRRPSPKSQVQPGEDGRIYHDCNSSEGDCRRLLPRRLRSGYSSTSPPIPCKLTKMRCSSFSRYFGHLERLGWVEETGKTEPSGIWDSYPPAPSRVFYRLTEAGKKATLAEVSNPLRFLYPEFDSAYFKQKRSGKHYCSKKK